MNDYRELLLGCGHARDKRLALPGKPLTWSNLTTLDRYEECDPDWLCDLDDVRPVWTYSDARTPPNDRYSMPLPSDHFDEVHAYEVLEHLGEQGDARQFFAHFTEIWRILKPSGHLLATCPSRYSAWLWGDPSHRRAILKETLVFLDQTMYARKDVGPMSDFRHLYRADFKIMNASDDHVHLIFCLQAVKPARL